MAKDGKERAFERVRTLAVRDLKPLERVVKAASTKTSGRTPPEPPPRR